MVLYNPNIIPSPTPAPPRYRQALFYVGPVGRARDMFCKGEAYMPTGAGVAGGAGVASLACLLSLPSVPGLRGCRGLPGLPGERQNSYLLVPKAKH